MRDLTPFTFSTHTQNLTLDRIPLPPESVIADPPPSPSSSSSPPLQLHLSLSLLPRPSIFRTERGNRGEEERERERVRVRSGIRKRERCTDPRGYTVPVNPVCAVAASGDARPHRPSIKKGEKRGESERAREREKGCIGVENENGVFPPLRPTPRAPLHCSVSFTARGVAAAAVVVVCNVRCVLSCPTVTLLKLIPLAAARKVGNASPTRVGVSLSTPFEPLVEFPSSSRETAKDRRQVVVVVE